MNYCLSDTCWLYTHRLLGSLAIQWASVDPNRRWGESTLSVSDQSFEWLEMALEKWGSHCYTLSALLPLGPIVRSPLQVAKGESKMKNTGRRECALHFNRSARKDCFHTSLSHGLNLSPSHLDREVWIVARRRDNMPLSTPHVQGWRVSKDWPCKRGVVNLYVSFDWNRMTVTSSLMGARTIFNGRYFNVESSSLTSSNTLRHIIHSTITINWVIAGELLVTNSVFGEGVRDLNIDRAVLYCLFIRVPPPL